MAKAEEGRRRRRYASGSCQQMMIRRIPNGEIPSTEMLRIPRFIGRKVTRGSETSQYPEEKKSKEIPLVAVSEHGTA